MPWFIITFSFMNTLALHGSYFSLRVFIFIMHLYVEVEPWLKYLSFRASVFINKKLVMNQGIAALIVKLFLGSQIWQNIQYFWYGPFYLQESDIRQISWSQGTMRIYLPCFSLKSAHCFSDSSSPCSDLLTEIPRVIFIRNIPYELLRPKKVISDTEILSTYHRPRCGKVYIWFQIILEPDRLYSTVTWIL